MWLTVANSPLLKAGRARTVEVQASDGSEEGDGGGGEEKAAKTARKTVRVAAPMPLVLCGCVPQGRRTGRACSESHTL